MFTIHHADTKYCKYRIYPYAVFKAKKGNVKGYRFFGGLGGLVAAALSPAAAPVHIAIAQGVLGVVGAAVG